MITRRRLLQAAPALAVPADLQPPVRTLERIDLVDPARGRTIATRIHMPAGAGPWPVVLFSHGFGGSLSAFGEAGRYWATRGVVVIHPTHTDSVQVPDPTRPPEDSLAVRQALAAAMSGRLGGPPLTEVMERPVFLRSRLADIGFLLGLVRKRDDRLPAAVRARIDPTRIGMAGHSFGAYLTLVLCGARLSPEPPPPFRRASAAAWRSAARAAADWASGPAPSTVCPCPSSASPAAAISARRGRRRTGDWRPSIAPCPAASTPPCWTASA
ncbi:MAG: hypothetical protein IM652_00960, partial [Phenylobacterium sp.]|nr:hypothetical protein [Phenylobacterium sp.]